MTADRDALRDLIQAEMHQTDEVTRWTLQAPVDLADAILSAGYRKPRTVTTVEELDALPVGSTVFWAEEAWLRVNTSSSPWKDFNGQTWTLVVTDDSPATVLYVPVVAA